ncbi:AraC family transcriptional regulator [Pseudomonas sp. PP3]|uniref:helix-turn-helix domain-containing protein n=1 Tax=Pseudomonas sp. PP3 TaxID=2815936 RepID=UPI001BAEB6FE|nr:AraC family transcriptional regulator [Pseudomonas sp. PP3]
MTALSKSREIAIRLETFKLIKTVSCALSVNAPAGYEKVLEEQLKVGLITLCLESPQEGSKETNQRLPLWKEDRAKELMNSGISENISINKIADACALSRSYFSRAFKCNTGMSPKEWFSRIRLQKSQELLVKTKKNIAEISLECGFSDQSHFSRVFKEASGISPKAWREKFSAN